MSTPDGNDNNPDAPAFTLTADQLEQRMKRAAREAVREAGLAAPREFLTTSQLAQRLRVGEKTVNTWARRDGLPVRIVGPKLQRFFWPDVEQWLMARGKICHRAGRRRRRGDT